MFATIHAETAEIQTGHLANTNFKRYRDSSVDIVKGYGLDGRDSIPGKGKIFFFTPHRPDRLWGPPSLVSNGDREFFP
jgi:hypothetical protein